MHTCTCTRPEKGAPGCSAWACQRPVRSFWAALPPGPDPGPLSQDFSGAESGHCRGKPSVRNRSRPLPGMLSAPPSCPRGPWCVGHPLRTQDTCSVSSGWRGPRPALWGCSAPVEVVGQRAGKQGGAWLSAVLPASPLSCILLKVLGHSCISRVQLWVGSRRPVHLVPLRAWTVRPRPALLHYPANGGAAIGLGRGPDHVEGLLWAGPYCGAGQRPCQLEGAAHPGGHRDSVPPSSVPHAPPPCSGSARVSRQDCPSGRQGHQWPFLPAKPQECGSSLSWKVPPSPPELPLFRGRKRMARKGLGGEAPSQHGPEDSS